MNTFKMNNAGYEQINLELWVAYLHLLMSFDTFASAVENSFMVKERMEN